MDINMDDWEVDELIDDSPPPRSWTVRNSEHQIPIHEDSPSGHSNTPILINSDANIPDVDDDIISASLAILLPHLSQQNYPKLHLFPQTSPGQLLLPQTTTSAQPQPQPQPQPLNFAPTRKKNRRESKSARNRGWPYPSQPITGPRRESSPSERSIISISSQSSSGTPSPGDLSRHYGLELGELPPVADCIAAQKFFLATLPVRSTSGCPKITSIYRHFMSKAVLNTGEDMRRHYCRVQTNGSSCPFNLKSTGGTRGRSRHIQKSHPEELDQLIEFRIGQGEDPCARNQLDRLDYQRSKSRKEEVISRQVLSVLIEGIACDQLPLSIFKGRLVKGLVSLINPSAKVPSRDMIDEGVITLYSKMSKDLKDIFNGEVIKGSITTDGWSSKGSRRKFVGITFHFVDTNFTLRSIALPLTPLEPPHTDNELRNTIYQNLLQWELVKMVECSTIDQGTNFKGAMSLLKRDNEINWLPCSAHNIQLCVNSALSQCGRAGMLMDMCTEISSYFRKNAYAMTLLVSEQQRRDPAVKPLVLLAPCPTNWTSTYLVPTRIQALIPAINSVVEILGDPKASSEERSLFRKLPQMLDSDDVSTLKGILTVLQGFKTFTDQASSASQPFISQLYPKIWEMKADTSTPSAPSDDPVIRLKQILNKELSERWTINEMPNSVLIATYLNPAMTQHPFFEEVIEYNNRPVDIRVRAKDLVMNALQLINRYNPNMEVMKRELKVQLYQYDRETSNGFHQRYRNDPLGWWKERSETYYYLSIVARVYFSIQASSAPSERLFSSAGNIFMENSQSLSDYITCRLLFIKSASQFFETKVEQEQELDIDDEDSDDLEGGGRDEELELDGESDEDMHQVLFKNWEKNEN